MISRAITVHVTTSERRTGWLIGKKPLVFVAILTILI
jgi:hypothetical protein